MSSFTTANSSKAVSSSLSLKRKKKMTRSAVLSNYHTQITNSVAEITVSISISKSTGEYVCTYRYVPAIDQKHENKAWTLKHESTP